MDRERIKERRIAAGLRQEDLAELAEVSRALVIKIESGAGEVLPRKLARVARALTAFETRKGIAP